MQLLQIYWIKLVITIIISPKSKCCHMVAVQLTTWPVSSTYLSWKLERYSSMLSVIGKKAWQILSLSLQVKPLLKSSILKICLGHGHIDESIRWILCLDISLGNPLPSNTCHPHTGCIYSYGVQSTQFC